LPNGIRQKSYLLLQTFEMAHFIFIVFWTAKVMKNQELGLKKAGLFQ